MRRWPRQPQTTRIDLSIFSFAFLTLAVICTIGTVAQPFPFHSGGLVELPHATAYQLLLYPVGRNAIAVEISRNERIFIGNDQIKAAALTKKIQSDLSNGAVQKIYIYADAYAKYACVKTVIDAIHDARIEHVVFLVSRTNSSSLRVLSPSNR